LLAVFRNLTRLRVGVSHIENVTSFWRTVEAKNLDRHRRTSFFNAITLVVDQRTNFTVLLTHNEDITLTQCAVLNQNRRNWTATHVKLRLDHGTLGGAIRVGFQFQNSA
jgi:hypothetical protein